MIKYNVQNISFVDPKLFYMAGRKEYYCFLNHYILFNNEAYFKKCIAYVKKKDENNEVFCKYCYIYYLTNKYNEEMAYKLIKPTGYKPIMDISDTERAITLIKDMIQIHFSAELKLRRVSAPLFVFKGTGINDDLNGIERPVSFPIKDLDEEEAEIVQSLAKWKRLALANHNIPIGCGIYTNLNTIRPDNPFSNIDSLYVDLWDWERVIAFEERRIEFLRRTVVRIFNVCKRIEYVLYENYPQIKPYLPDIITLVHAQDLMLEFPHLTTEQRVNEVAKKYKAVFIEGIGATMGNGLKHEERAPDYDDWISETGGGYKGLNGDIVFWNPILEQAVKISSMGIRVDKQVLMLQLEIENVPERTQLYWHQKLLSGGMPLSIGGGIEQSRLCMFYLKKAHIGEVQSSIWPQEMLDECMGANIPIMQ